METQADSGAAEPLRDREFQKLLKSSSSASLTSEASHNASGEHVGTPSHHGSQVLITEKRQPLSSVSSLEVHFDLLDLTELTDMSDQELGEVFADSDEENHTESPATVSPLVWRRSKALDPQRTEAAAAAAAESSPAMSARLQHKSLTAVSLKRSP
uniref:Dysbindin domain-containing protein 1 n=1 Tax=Cyprinus carpio carpio TaxID=630221 RepID=A0A9J7XBD3_CYPCA